MLKYLVEIQKKKMAPKGLGFVHRKDEKEINLESFHLPESYVDAFGDGLKISKTVKKLVLRRNQLTSSMILKILDNVPWHLEQLDLSYNPLITQQAIVIICEDILDNPRFCLK